MTEWGKWSQHDDNGISHRVRFMIQEDLNGGSKCPPYRQTKLGSYVVVI